MEQEYDTATLIFSSLPFLSSIRLQAGYKIKYNYEPLQLAAGHGRKH